MESAFGIDHGEVSKAIPGMAGLGSKIAGGTMKAGQKLRSSGRESMSMGRRAGEQHQGIQSSIRPSGRIPGQGMRAGGAAKVKAGGMLRSLGQGMAKRPGLTGGVATGGAAAGAGGMMMNRRRF